MHFVCNLKKSVCVSTLYMFQVTFNEICNSLKCFFFHKLIVLTITFIKEKLFLDQKIMNDFFNVSKINSDLNIVI